MNDSIFLWFAFSFQSTFRFETYPYWYIYIAGFVVFYPFYYCAIVHYINITSIVYLSYSFRIFTLFALFLACDYYQNCFDDYHCTFLPWYIWLRVFSHLEVKLLRSIFPYILHYYTKYPTIFYESYLSVSPTAWYDNLFSSTSLLMHVIIKLYTKHTKWKTSQCKEE